MIPDHRRSCGGIEKLESILSRVAGSRQQNGDTLDSEFPDLVPRRQFPELPEQFRRFRALHRKTSKVVTEVRYRNFTMETRLHPGKVFFDLRGVYDEEIVVAGTTVYDEIIDHAALLIQQQRILSVAHFE